MDESQIVIGGKYLAFLNLEDTGNYEADSPFVRGLNGETVTVLSKCISYKCGGFYVSVPEESAHLLEQSGQVITRNGRDMIELFPWELREVDHG